MHPLLQIIYLIIQKNMWNNVANKIRNTYLSALHVQQTIKVTILN